MLRWPAFLDGEYNYYYCSFYSQTEGGPMGSPLTVALAEVRVTNIESLALASSYTSILLTMAYLDTVTDSMQSPS